MQSKIEYFSRHRREILLFALISILGICMLIFSAASSAQHGNANIRSYSNANFTPTPELPKTTVRGRAVYEDSGRPVRRASIMLVGSNFGGREGGVGLTDNNGAFEIKNVPEGKYYTIINAPGVLNILAYSDLTAKNPLEAMEESFVEVNKNFEEIVVPAGGGQIDVFVRAKRGGAISGRVHYADGDAAIGVKVEVLRKKDDKFMGVLSNFSDLAQMMFGGGAIGGGKTDDRGVYRISGLPPGEYIVRVTEPASHQNKKDGDQGGDASFLAMFGGSISSLVSTYHPSAPDPSKATVITLELAQEAAEVNIVIPERGFYNVAGKVVARNTRQPLAKARVSLLRNDNAVSFTDRLLEEELGRRGGAILDEAGTFGFKELPAGTYKLIVRPPDNQEQREYDENGIPKPNQKPFLKYAPVEKEITITDKDLSDLVIELPLGGSISGTIVAEGNKPLPNFITVQALDDKYEPLDTHYANEYDKKAQPRLKADFMLDGLPAAKIFVEVQARVYGVNDGSDEKDKTIYYVKAIKQGTKDLLVAPLELSESENAGNTQIILGTDGGRLKGKVKLKTEDKPAANRRIMLIPVEENKWLSRTSRLFAVTNAEGEFEVMGAPIEYFVIFLTDKDKTDDKPIERNWIRERSKGAEKITIKAGGETSINLTAP